MCSALYIGIFCTLLGVADICCADANQPSIQDKPSEVRSNLINRVVARDDCDYMVWRRAIDEAARTAGDEQRRQLLMCRLLDSKERDTIDIALALAKIKGSLLPLVSKVKVENQSFSRILILLSLRGKGASDCAGWLAEAAKNAAIDSTLKARSRVVLWKMGVDKDKNASAIRKVVASRTKEGYSVVGFLTATGGQELVDVGLCRQLGAWVDKDDLASLQAAMLLGRCGKLAQPTIPRLREFLKVVQKDDERRAAYLIVGIALSDLLEGQDQNDLLRSICQRIGNPQEHTETAVLPSLMKLATPEVIRWVTLHVNDPNDAVASGAIRAASAVGLDASACGNKLLGVIDSDRADTLRSEAAIAFGLVGEPANKRALSDRLKKEASSEVREAIVRGLRTLELKCDSIGK